ncbi:MAG: hypothetical protein M1358_04215, partial [Chloroflexi bacterium]|nr:hypothetical protein [Chloroflexota bacterium]
MIPFAGKRGSVVSGVIPGLRQTSRLAAILVLVAMLVLQPATSAFSHNGLASQPDPAQPQTESGVSVPEVSPQDTAPPQQDPRFFPATGFRVSDDRFFDFFNKRGGLRTFGFPTSRVFTLLGTQVQFFQRRIMQLQPDGSVGLLNVMDPGLMPYNLINGATLPPHDPDVASRAPQPGSPNFSQAAISFLQAQAPEVFDNQPVHFFTTFMDTVTFQDAFPGGQGDPGALLGFDLEMWGFPTSNPLVDPNNFAFIYLRFQRGIMH